MHSGWTAWRLKITSSNLTAFTDRIAKDYFVGQHNLTIPVNPSELCK
jgi:hypothetical protein